MMNIYRHYKSIVCQKGSPFELTRFGSKTDKAIVTLIADSAAPTIFISLDNSGNIVINDGGMLFERYQGMTIDKDNIWSGAKEQLDEAVANCQYCRVIWNNKMFPKFVTVPVTDVLCLEMLQEFCKFYTTCDNIMKEHVNEYRKEHGYEIL